MASDDLLDRLAPMKAVSGSLPPEAEDDQWAYEIKWDGMRVLTAVRGRAKQGALAMRSVNGIDVVHRFPEVEGLPAHLAGHTAVLDGEVVAFDAEGRPSFGTLQQRMHLSSRAEAVARSAAVPVAYVIFDLLHLDGQDTVDLPYLDRRRLLLDLVEPRAGWLVPAHHVGDGQALYDQAAAQGLEGVMAKRIGSTYEPGRRSHAWRKVKVRRRQELVVGGWSEGAGNRSGGLGALLVGYHDDAGFRFAGKVGTGFTAAELDRLQAQLGPLAVDEPPFVDEVPRPIARTSHWVRPELVAEVEFAEWTGDGRLRHPAYLGLRFDKDPRDVVREER